ncbi:MAG TPA: 30S ribosomal protein S20 [Gemmatimonadales bacterium]|nr:30S ribosomal protein S20 [Gemmatimonadales bacterium]
MPRIESAKKRLRQSTRRTALNRAQRAALRTALRKVRSAATPEEARTAYRAAEKLLDRAARKNLVHRNTAARQKSRLMKAMGGKK